MGYKIENSISEILIHLGSLGRIDLNDPNFKGTPERVAKAWMEMSGPGDMEEKINQCFSKEFPKKYDGMVVKGPIQTWSLCPHHFFPWKVIAYVGYIPDEKGVIGISKIPRLVRLLAQSFILQEDLTQRIATILQERTNAMGTGVIVDGLHTCQCARGVRSEDWTTTATLLQGFKKEDVKKEFFYHVDRKKEVVPR